MGQQLVIGGRTRAGLDDQTLLGDEVVDGGLDLAGQSQDGIHQIQSVSLAQRWLGRNRGSAIVDGGDKVCRSAHNSGRIASSVGLDVCIQSIDLGRNGSDNTGDRGKVTLHQRGCPGDLGGCREDAGEGSQGEEGS